MTSEIQILSEEMEKLLNRISDDLTSTLVNLDGSLKGIDSGTRIKIPTDVGYVNCYKSANNLEITVWLKESIQDEIKREITDFDQEIED